MTPEHAAGMRILCERFSNDPSSPSLIVSWLACKQQWYVAFVRYEKPFGQGRRTVVTATDADLDTALAYVLHGANDERD